ncbi:hypothetical protein JCM24511_04886 [Saitozyma sp. JCM 24511]|nr:hypothetical protein JCM24511_04886 [Saitozyma sp. JCM 24511]
MPDLTPSSTVNDGLSMPGTVSGVQTPTVKDPARFLTPKARKTEADGTQLAGRPNPHTFPFASIILNLKPPLSTSSEPAASSAPTALEIAGEDLEAALQYGPSAGLPQLRGVLEDLQSTVHKREKGTGWTVSVGSGSQDLMYKGFQTVLSPGDPVLLETPLYAGALPAIRMLGAELVEVDVDEQGLSAINLERVLASWPEGKKQPRVIYSTPTGCNPSGCSASRERKLAVLEVCKKYDILIFEDDPYYYLTQTLIPSYFELEKQVIPEGGHVLRFDSMSKLLSAGMRLGWVTGPKALVHAIDVITSGANLHTSSISQVMAYRLLGHWGISGFVSHCAAVADFYAERREVFEAIARKHLDGLARWVSPVAGMFLWIDLSPAGITDTYELIRHEAYEKGVLAVPGYAFYPSGRKSSHLRVAFSVCDMENDVDLGFSRLATAIKDKRKQFGLK